MNNQEDDLIVDCVNEIQNIDQSISLSIDVIVILVNFFKREGVDHSSSTPIFSTSCAQDGCPPLVMDNRSTSILKHIDMLEEDEWGVFVDALDDMSL